LTIYSREIDEHFVIKVFLIV